MLDHPMHQSVRALGADIAKAKLPLIVGIVGIEGSMAAQAPF
jgi:hypothetical protein